MYYITLIIYFITVLTQYVSEIIYCIDIVIDYNKLYNIYTRGIQKVLRQILKKNSEYGNQIESYKYI